MNKREGGEGGPGSIGGWWSNFTVSNLELVFLHITCEINCSFISSVIIHFISFHNFISYDIMYIKSILDFILKNTLNI